MYSLSSPVFSAISLWMFICGITVAMFSKMSSTKSRFWFLLFGSQPSVIPVLCFQTLDIFPKTQLLKAGDSPPPGPTTVIIANSFERTNLTFDLFPVSVWFYEVSFVSRSAPPKTLNRVVLTTESRVFLKSTNTT